MKHVIFAAGMTFLFFLLVSIGTEGVGARSGGVALVAQFFIWLLVDPMTLPGALTFVFAVVAFFSFISYPGRNSDFEQAQRAGQPIAAGAETVAGVMSHQSPSERGGFGRRTGSIPAPRSAAPSMDIGLEKRALRENGLDWYLSEHGFEGRWKQVARQLNASGEKELADALTKAGIAYDRWEEKRTSRPDGELTQKETDRYFAELAPCERQIKGLV